VTQFITADRPAQTAQPTQQLAAQHDARRLRLFSGTSNAELAAEIAAYLGVPDGPRVIKRFADGELYIQIQESIRGCDVFLIQPTCAPVNDHLMELLIMVDACRRASARQITAVIPYYGYARADRKTAGRESITAKLVANLLTKSGVDRVLAMDLHSNQIQGYFDIPCDHIYGSPVLVDYLSTRDLGEVVVVSPDVGGVARARGFAKQMNDAPLAIIDKRRSGHNVAESLTVIGDVAGKTAVLIDDMIDTGGTICAGARLLRERGATRVLACATHAVFSPPAIERLSAPGLFEEVIVTNSIPLSDERRFPQLQVLSVANMLGEAIWRIHDESSVSSMFR
jgi:ribose-phosphate pyrophosphokinase